MGISLNALVCAGSGRDEAQFCGARQVTFRMYYNFIFDGKIGFRHSSWNRYSHLCCLVADGIYCGAPRSRFALLQWIASRHLVNQN